MFDVVLRAGRLAREMRSEAKKIGLSGFGPARCRDLVAQLLGSEDHRSLLEDCRGADSVLRDESVMKAKDVVHLRGMHAVMLMERTGIPVNVAIDLVMKLEPLAPPASGHPDFFVMPGSAVRHAARAGLRQAEMRRKLAGLIGTEVTAARMDAFDRLISPGEISEFAPSETIWDAIGAMLYLDDIGWPMQDMETYFQIGIPILLKSAKGLAGSAKMHRLAAFIASTGERTVGYRHPDADVQFEGEVFEAFMTIFQGLELVEVILEAAEHSLRAGRAAVNSSVSAMRGIVAAGGTFRDMATYHSTYAVNDGMSGIRETADKAVAKVLNDAAAAAGTIPMPVPAACGRAAGRALSKVLKRGVPHVFLEADAAGYWHFEDVVLPGPNGRHHLLSDTLIAARRARYTLADLSRSAVEAARSATAEIDVSPARKWGARLDKLSLAGRDVPELRMVAIAMNIFPDLGTGPSAFFRKIAELDLLDRAGVGFDDVVGFMLVRPGRPVEVPPLWKPTRTRMPASPTTVH